jgi:four helix bundle protein
MQLDDLIVYNLANEIGEQIWQIVQKWSYLEKQTVGIQLIDAIDSVAANLAEGFGRYHFNENKHFCYYARGSLSETKCWLKKANNRKLITESEYLKLTNDIEKLSVKINNYISIIGKQVDEPSSKYGADSSAENSDNPANPLLNSNNQSPSMTTNDYK